MTPSITASFFSLTGAGFAQPARYGFLERCRAAGRAGFNGVGLRAEDFEAHAEDLSADAMLEILTQTGVAVTEIEFLGGWAHADSDDSSDAAGDTLLRMADLFGPHHVTAGEFTGAGIDVAVAARQLRRFCDRAATRGLTVAIEPFPWSGLSNVATARQIIERAEAPNAGLMIDVWHFFNSRSTFDDLAGLTKEQIVAVQLNDGRLVDGDFLVEARAARLLPGDGELDITGLLGRLADIGFDGPYCVEVGYPQLRALPVDEMATVIYQKTVAVLDRSSRIDNKRKAPA